MDAWGPFHWDKTFKTEPPFWVTRASPGEISIFNWGRGGGGGGGGGGDGGAAQRGVVYSLLSGFHGETLFR